MIRKQNRLLIIVTVLLILANHSKAQDIQALGTGNYAGIAGITQNPASIVDSRYKFDINLFGISTTYNNNYLSIKKDAILKGSFFKSPYNKNFDAVRHDLITENTLAAGEKIYGNVNTRIQLPLSFMLTTGPRSAIALNIESRTGVQLSNVAPELAKMAYENFKYKPYYGQVFNADGMSVNALSWVDVGLTYGRILYNNGNHFVKAAVTAKYVGGAASLYNNYDKLQYTFADSGNLVINSATAKYGHSATTDFNKFKTTSNFKPDAGAPGFDFGLVYEFRGRINNFLYSDAVTATEKARRDKNKYTFRLSAALVDVGKLSFDKSEFARDFTATGGLFNFKQINANTVGQIDTAIAQRVLYTESKGTKYDVALPTALNINFDLHILKGLYINLGTFQPVKLNKSAQSRIDAISNYTVTPRWETRFFGLYVPFSYNQYKDIQLGATLRVGPLYIGSANVGTVLFNDKIKNADMHVGLHIPIGFGRPSKLSRLLKTASDKEEAVEIADNKKAVVNEEPVYKKEAIAPASVVAPVNPYPQVPVNIVINNYSNGNPVPVQQQMQVVSDTVIRIQKDIKYNAADSVQWENTHRQIDNLMQSSAEKEARIKQLEETLKKRNNSKEVIIDGPSNKEIRDELDKLKIEQARVQSLNDNYRQNNNYQQIPVQQLVPKTIETIIVRDTMYVQKDPEKVIVNTNTDHTAEKLLHMQLEKVLFNVGRSTINPVYYQNLNFVAKQLRAYPELKLQLDGYTDATGNAGANLLLSQKRSEAIKNYITAKGIDNDKITVNYHGPEMPVADNKTNDGKLLNRRVELSFVK